MRNSGMKSYYFLPIFFGIPILSLIFMRQLLETTSKLKYLGNFLNCLSMEFCQITELCFFATIHFWLTLFSRKIKNFPYILLNAFFVSIYGHIAFLGVCDFNAGLNGMQFITPSAFNIWVNQKSGHIDHFSQPLYSVPVINAKRDMSFQIVLEVLKVGKNFYLTFILIYTLFFTLTIYLVIEFKNKILKTTLVGQLLPPLCAIKENSRTHTKSEQNEQVTIQMQTVDTEKKQSEEGKKGEPINGGNQEENYHEKRDSNRSFIKLSAVKETNQENGIAVKQSQFDITHTQHKKLQIDNKKWIQIILHIMSVIYITVILYIIYNDSDFKTKYYSRVSFIQSSLLSLTHFEKDISHKVRNNLVNYVRGYLPPGRKWLDTRPNPVYPAVHADIETFCAYNSQHKDCKDLFPKPQVPLVEKLPNVLFIVFESFTPGTYLIDNDFLFEHASRDEDDPLRYITDTKYYNSLVMNKFNKIQDYAITFSGMNSLGIPTASGFHSLMTGMYPSQSFYNILDGSLLHTDDFPSQMMNYGYRSFWVAASEYRFDGINLWYFRKSAREEAMQRLKCRAGFGDLIDDEYHRQLVGNERMSELRDCDEKEIEKEEKVLKKRRLDFPKWFDYALHYPLTKYNAELIHLPPESALNKTKWAADRVSTKEFINHWKQQKDFMKKNNITKPLFGGITTMDSHFEFFGYDKKEFYDTQINKKNVKNNDDWTRQRFIRVNRYADKYVGGLLEWFKENEPETIFVVTGDHSVRKVPVFESDEIVTRDVVYSSECVHQSSGSDAFFVTSGMLGYFGNNTAIKNVLQFDKLKGKTMKLPTDHNDLIYTVEDILTRLNGTTVQPTQRRSRNLIDLTSNLIDHINNKTLKEEIREIDKSHWNSFSFNHYTMDYKEGTNLLRVHPADKAGSHLYTKASYPQCIRKKNRLPLQLGTKEGNKVFERMEKKFSAENYLTYHNRLYNYALRDRECVKKGHCEFPETGGPLDFYDFSFPVQIGMSLLKITIVLWVTAEIVTLGNFAVRKIIGNKNYMEL